MAVMFEANQLQRLRALGIVPLRQRAVALDEARAPDAPVAQALDQVDQPDIGLRLWFPPTVADPFQGSDARLLRDLLRSLELDVEQVTRLSGENDEALPVLAFGTGGPDGSVRLPALEKLRNPLEKRIAWPVLRGLRRRLGRSVS